MSKVTYTNLKLKKDASVKTFEFNEQTIEVLKYLPIDDKYDLIMITLQQAEENGVYNPMLLEQRFNLNLVYMYTNITFTEKQKEDESKIYDCLMSSGFLDKFFEVIDEDEYNLLYDYLNEYAETMMQYRTTAGYVMQEFINDLPEKMKMAGEIIDNFNPDKYKEVVDFAKAANGGREINQ